MVKTKDEAVLPGKDEEPVVGEPVEDRVTFIAPSPVDRGQLYVESHPILGVTKIAHVTKNSIGDGRIGDGATVVRE